MSGCSVAHVPEHHPSNTEKDANVLFTLFCFVAQERQKQLESLGISLQSSGIKVGEDKCFLVNLNADPALNELLVYYLKVMHNLFVVFWVLFLVSVLYIVCRVSAGLKKS